ncbi:XrtB/PEP-CTERM-associated polysaccharide biosynthesis outer membrane protein EpsL [Rhodoferax sp. BLA1]|uniref:XrtB/PEP-CTERM-associated polysaccharide biosynthesis outer membrane protein EpsL n=1 Tax=Rhodoferax sp. BLA1 TaxID=2576062 RepID=UPI0015D45E59|nr:XrtB/PEP-CTERM-associated polysaccharide biosynthesis outer membrane protein EpsL [Rhodoferax sp. BLA1]
MLQAQAFWLVTLLALISTTSARAQQQDLVQVQDTLMFRADYTLQSDSNLQRLPASANVSAQTGRDSTAERIGISTLGVSFNKAYSLQRLELDLSVLDYSYQNFSQYSFTATNYAAAWRWSITPRFHGSLTADRLVTPNNPSDAPDVTQRNLRTTSNTGFDAIYDMDGTWSLLAGLSRTNQTNQVALGTGDDYNANTASVGVRRASGSNSVFTYNLKTSSGRYLTASANNREFDQIDNGVNLSWVLSGNTTANLSAVHIDRNHPSQPQRDYSGFNTGVAINWNITGKTALAASWARQLGSYQTGYSNHTLSNRLSLGPTWRIGSKTYLGLRYDLTYIDYLGAPDAGSITQRKDTLRDASLSLNWQPFQFVAFNASLKKSTRDAAVTNLAPLDYSSTVGKLSADFSF